MFEFLYDSWKWIAGISIALGVIAPIVTFIFPDRNKNKEKNTKAHFVGIVISVISCMFIFDSLMVALSFSRVPDLYAANLFEAKQLLYEADLEIIIPENVNYTVTDYVKCQAIDKDVLVLKGTRIRVDVESTVSEDIKKTVDVPNVVGEKYENAIALLVKNNLQYRARIMGESNASLSQYYVSYQSVSADSSIPEGTVIDLELSLEEVNVPPIQNPSDLIPVPKLVGLEEQEAVNLLSSIGLDSNVYWRQGNDENADRYYILNQSIPEGSLVGVGTVIELERSPKQPGSPVEVPNVIGMEQIEAAQLLMKNGLQFQVWWTTEENKTHSDVYYIKGQSVKSGDVVSAGTLVKLELTSKNPNS